MNESVVRMCIALTVASGGAAAGVQAWEAVHGSAAETLSEVQRVNDEQLVRAARIANALSREGVSLPPTEAELVREGYLTPEFLTREKVSTQPLDLPEISDEPEAAE